MYLLAVVAALILLGAFWRQAIMGIGLVAGVVASLATLGGMIWLCIIAWHLFGGIVTAGEIATPSAAMLAEGPNQAFGFDWSADPKLAANMKAAERAIGWKGEPVTNQQRNVVPTLGAKDAPSSNPPAGVGVLPVAPAQNSNAGISYEDFMNLDRKSGN